MRKLFIIFFGIVLMITPMFGAVILVPGQYATILDAYMAADSGDTLLVAPGTYHGEGWTEVIFYIKSVKIYSQNGPGETIINGQGSRKGWGFREIENSRMEVVGFSFIDCVGFEIGAVNFHRNSPVTMRNCVIVRGKATRTNPEAVGEGGGIRCWGSSPTITDCIIQECEALQGGGFSLLENANPVIRRCVITNNSWGTGVLMQEDCDPLIEDCQITFNQASDLSYAGGMGIYARSNAIVNRCFIANNRNDYTSGGGIRVEASSPVITNTFILDNDTFEDAGALLCRDRGNPVFISCTMAGNTASRKADGIGSYLYSNPTFYNCIIWHPDWEFHFQDNGIMYGEYCNSTVDLTGVGPGNFSLEPGFIGSGNYHLATTSPCIDRGFDYGVVDDYDGDSRPQSCGVDVGADEVPFSGSVGVDLQMPGTNYRPGDTFYLNVACTNTGPARSGIPLLVALDIYGEFLFWPSWRHGLDYRMTDIPAGGKTVSILPAFAWPAGAGSASGIVFYSCFMNPGLTQICGNLDSVGFGWSAQ